MLSSKQKGETRTFREVEATSTRHKLAPSDQSVTLMLELSTGDVETVVEVEAKSLWDFMGNIAGNLGMIFGTSIYSLQFPSIASYNRYLR